MNTNTSTKILEVVTITLEPGILQTQLRTLDEMATFIHTHADEATTRQQVAEWVRRFGYAAYVVGNHQRTLELFNEWAPELSARGLRAAFVLQNGLEYPWERFGPSNAILPWEEAAAFFIGGDTPFKFSRVVREIVQAANLWDKWVHMGRVNSVQRMAYAQGIGCDSCDGSGMARFPNSVLLPMVRALHLSSLHAQQQPEFKLDL